MPKKPTPQDKSKQERRFVILSALLCLVLSFSGLKIHNYLQSSTVTVNSPNVDVSARVCHPLSRQQGTLNAVEAPSCTSTSWSTAFAYVEGYANCDAPTNLEYYLEVSDNPVFVAPLQSSGWISETEFELTISLYKDEYYYYRFKARDADDTSQVSDWSDMQGCIPTVGESEPTQVASPSTGGGYVRSGSGSSPSEDEGDSENLCPNPFPDTGGHWGEYYICRLHQMDIIHGYPDGYYRPDKSINRVEILKISTRLFYDIYSISENTTLAFRDANQFAWYNKYIHFGMGVNIVEGYYDETFRPSNMSSRAETLKMLLEASNLERPASLTKMPFTDILESEWYVPYLEYAYDMGIVEGYPDRTFRPHADVTRAEAAKMAYLIWELEILEDMAKLFGDDNEES